MKSEKIKGFIGCLFCLILTILLCSVSFADDIDAHGEPFGATAGVIFNGGFEIIPLENRTITSINVSADCTATRIQILNSSKGEVAVNTSLDNKNGGFNFNVTKGVKYYVIADDSGGSYDLSYGTGNFNYTTSNFNWTCEYYSGNCIGFANTRNIESIISQPNPIPPLPPEVSSRIDLLFRNKTQTDHKIIFDEGENYIVETNWTSTNESVNLTPANGGTCNISIQNGLVELEGDFDNFSLCDSGCNFSKKSKLFNISSTNAINDSLHFNGCHEQTASGNMEINFSCSGASEIISVLASEMPLCADGTSFIRKTTNICIGETTINISTDTAGNIPFSQRKRILDVAFDREYSIDLNVFGEGVFYNSTTKLFTTNHTHEFYDHGSKKIWTNCSIGNVSLDNSTTENITIVNLPPLGSIDQMILPNGSIITLTNNIIIEFVNGSWEILASASDDDLSSINLSVYNSSQMIFTTNNLSQTNISSSFFLDFDSTNPFIINLTATDTEGLNVNVTLTFNITDTQDPVCNFEGSYDIISNQTLTFGVTCTDENFFSLNVTCPANSFNSFDTGLNVKTFLFDDPLLNPVADTCIFKYCDGHTAETLKKDWYISTDRNGFEFIIDSKHTNTFWCMLDGDMSYKKETDRIEFTMDMDNKVSEYLCYYQTSENSYYFKDDKYQAWIVDSDSETWFDLNGVDSAYVIQRSNGLYEIRIKNSVPLLSFKSIGELNCIEGSFVLNDVFDKFGIWNPLVCPADQSENDLLLYFFIGALLVAIIWLNEMFFQIPVFNFTAGLGFIIMSLPVFACYRLIAVPIFAFGIGIVYMEFDRFNK